MKLQIKHFILLLFILVISCKSKTSINPNIKSSELDYVVLEYNPTEKFPFFGNFISSELTIGELSEVNRIIDEKINQVITSHNSKLKQDDIYKAQYIPVLNEKGEKEVWVNFFCSDQNYWKKGIVLILDGGDCYFSIKVNLKTKTFYEFIQNGIA